MSSLTIEYPIYFQASADEIIELATSCRPSRFEAFLDAWTARGHCITGVSDDTFKDELLRGATSASAASRNLLTARLGSKELPFTKNGFESAASEPRLVMDWEAFLGPRIELISENAVEFLQLILSDRIKKTALTIIDPYFLGDDPASKSARIQILQRALQSEVSNITVLTRPSHWRHNRRRTFDAEVVAKSIKNQCNRLSEAVSAAEFPPELLCCYCASEEDSIATIHDRYYVVSSNSNLKFGWCWILGRGVSSFSSSTTRRNTGYATQLSWKTFEASSWSDFIGLKESDLCGFTRLEIRDHRA